MAYQRLQQIHEEGALIPIRVESARPAGLIVKVFSAMQGFIPGSHVQEVRRIFCRGHLNCLALPCMQPVCMLLTFNTCGKCNRALLEGMHGNLKLRFSFVATRNKLGLM